METTTENTKTMYKNQHNKWTDEELAFLIDNRKESADFLSELLYRSPSLISAMVHRITSGDLQYLIEADTTKRSAMLKRANAPETENSIVKEAESLVKNYDATFVAETTNGDTSAPVIVNETDNEKKKGGYTAKRWSEKEMRFCIDNENKGADWLVDQTGRTQQSIGMLFWRLKSGDQIGR